MIKTINTITEAAAAQADDQALQTAQTQNTKAAFQYSWTVTAMPMVATLTLAQSVATGAVRRQMSPGHGAFALVTAARS